MINDYFKKKNGLYVYQNIISYSLAGITQIIIDNPLSSYRQMLQQYSKDSKGNLIDPKITTKKTNLFFCKYPFNSITSGLKPRIIGNFYKSVPKISFIFLFSHLFQELGDSPGIISATFASILSAPIINPMRMIEKQQRDSLKRNGIQKKMMSIIKETSEKKYKPLLRGTTPLMMHSIISASLGLVGQPKLKKNIENKLANNTQFTSITCSLISSSLITPIYVLLTNPLTRIEIIMQTNPIKNKSINLKEASKIIIEDTRNFGLKGLMRGQGIGVVKGILALTVFQESRILYQNSFKKYNIKYGI